MRTRTKLVALVFVIIGIVWLFFAPGNGHWLADTVQPIEREARARGEEIVWRPQEPAYLDLNMSAARQAALGPAGVQSEMAHYDREFFWARLAAGYSVLGSLRSIVLGPSQPEGPVASPAGKHLGRAL